MHRLAARLKAIEERAGGDFPEEKVELVFIFNCFMDWTSGLWSSYPDLSTEEMGKVPTAGALSHPDIRRMIEAVYFDRKQRGEVDDPTVEAFIERELAHFRETWKF